MRFISLLAIALVASLNACALDLGQDSRYGNYGGPPRQDADDKVFSLEITDTKGVRWFPNYVNYSPDDSHLLVSLCHTGWHEFCRIAKFHIADRRWEILPHEPTVTYRFPVYSPDGKWIVLNTAPCTERKRWCNEEEALLVRMRPDGSGLETLADTNAWYPSFANDGSKLIYWSMGGRNPHTGKKTFVLANADVAELDWTSRRERLLTQFSFWPEHRKGRPYFTPDGKSFVFGGFVFSAPGGPKKYLAGPTGLASSYLQRDDEFNTGGTIYRLPPERKRVTLWRVPVQDEPYRSKDVPKFIPLWPNEFSWSAIGMTKDGRVLYFASIASRHEQGSPVAAALLAVQDRASRALASRRNAIFLRGPEPGAQDEAAFDTSARENCLSTSGDDKRLAFCRYSTTWVNQSLCTIALGEYEPTCYDWPKLTLEQPK